MIEFAELSVSPVSAQVLVKLSCRLFISFKCFAQKLPANLSGDEAD